MWKHLRSGVLWAGVCGLTVFGLVTTPASAQLFNRHCRHCQRPPTTCHCTSHQPMVETQMIPRQTTVLRNEVVTQYRQEAYTQAVPVTTYRNVTVDEGGYQMVYVPKPVTKQVAQTTYQQQTAYRTVPYQATRQVPQVVTQMVPQQIVRQQPYSFTTAQTGPVIPMTTAIAPTYSPVTAGCAPIAVPCGPCGGIAFAPAPIYSATPIVSQPIITAPISAVPMAPNPVTMLPPTSTSAMLAPTPAADIDPSSGPVPDPKFLESPGAVKESWTTVGSRYGDRASGSDSARLANNVTNKSTRFKPASSMYRSWESQSRIAGSDTPSRR